MTSSKRMPTPELASLDSTPQFTCEQAEAFLAEHYGIEGVATELPSERDQNFRIRVSGKDRYVLKIANAEEEKQILEFQSGAFHHAQKLGVPLDLPKAERTLTGEELAEVYATSGTSHLMRLVSWVHGGLFVDAPEKSERLLSSAGEKLAELDRALSGYEHPGMHRELCWDMKHLAGALEHLPLLRDTERAIVEKLSGPALSLDWEKLEKSVIHGDANDHNLLVRDGAVTGLIDFGDMVRSALAAEPAIAAAYAMLGSKTPLLSASQLVRAYLAVLPLKPDDRRAILPLMIGRLCMSVCFAAQNARAKPDDPYQLVSTKPAWAVLEELAKSEWDALREHWDGLLTQAQASTSSKTEALLADRRAYLGPNLSTSYDQPLNIVRGDGAYLIDETGRRFLDCVNNVSHVGHCHPKVVEAGITQMRTLNTNTRYLNSLLTEYARELTATLPEPLDTVFFTNSGSEANELALRLARTHTGRFDVGVLDVAYHGTTTSLIDMSPYKHNGPGGCGAPPWVHVAPIPDPYRGLHRGEESGPEYAQDVARTLQKSEHGVAAFFTESALGCGGQVILPDGFLAAAYQTVRASGGLCVADEVQTGMGRAGSHFWMFETQGVIPDIVTIGKPIGNGHPMAAVVTTKEIARSFANGMEYFNTFGGNPVSCAIGRAVLKVVEEERLQDNALKVGSRFKHAFETLSEKQVLIGDVRGQGLFLGVELVTDRGSLEPAKKEARFVIERLRNRGILLSTDGPHNNVLKIKPPIVFPEHEVDRVVAEIDLALSEISG